MKTLTNVVIIDTGDNYVLTLDRNMKIAKDVYSMLGIDFEKIHTGCRVVPGSEDAAVVFETFGRVNERDPSILKLILEKLQHVLSFADVKVEYKRLQKRFELKHLSASDWPDVDLSALPDMYLPESRLSTGNTQPYSNVADNYLADFQYGVLPLGDPSTEGDHRYTTNVLFHTSYNVCIVYDATKHDIDQFCEDFPEFVMVHSIASSQIGPELRNELNRFFCRQCFESKANAAEHVDSFVKLHRIGDQNNQTINGVFQGNSERDCIMKHIGFFFDVTNSANDQMRVSEFNSYMSRDMILPNHKYNWAYCPADRAQHSLVGMASNRINFENKAMEKKAAGYLIQLGVSKKNVDGEFYFCGIRVKDRPVANGASVQDLDDRRKNEIRQIAPLTPKEQRQLFQSMQDRNSKDTFEKQMDDLRRSYKLMAEVRERCVQM